MSSLDVIDLAGDDDAPQQQGHRAVDNLVEMGFDRAHVAAILSQCNNNEETALEILLSGSPQPSPSSASASASSPIVAQPPAPTADSITICTYNIWFEHEHTYAVRMKALSSLVSTGEEGVIGEATSPSILAMQEVTQPQAALLNLNLGAKGWREIVHQTTPAPYWVSMATRQPCGAPENVRTHKFAVGSAMGRALLYGEMDTPLGRILCGTVHLESFVPSIPAKSLENIRCLQLKEAGAVMLQHCRREGCEMAVLMGDTNWTDNKDGSNTTQEALPEWTDVFDAANKPENCRYTYDGKVNAMMAHGFRNRFDRIFFWTNPSLPSAESIQLKNIYFLGTAPISGHFLEKTFNRKNKPPEQRQMPMLPSDHFGLCATFSNIRRAPSSCNDKESEVVSKTDLRHHRSSESNSLTSGNGKKRPFAEDKDESVPPPFRRRDCNNYDTATSSSSGSSSVRSVEDVRAARLMRFESK